MEIQGKKATTHDFLSLYKEPSGLTQLDPTPSPQEFHRKKTQDFLQPFEEKGSATPTATSAASKQLSTVKPEPSEVHSSGGAFVLWEEDPVPLLPKERTTIITGAGRHQHHPKHKQRSSSSSPCTAPIGNSSFGSILSGRKPTGQERRSMDTVSKSGRGFTDEDEDDEVIGRRETSSQKELTVKIDRKANPSNNDQEATTPRSKHSATEQRRRSKINDRFQILRDLIPHSDQKRDKASFLLEVIEYIQFLQEKVQKFEPGYPVWSQESMKMMPWKNNQVPIEIIAEPSHTLRNGPSAPGLVISGDNIIPVTQLDSENVNSGLAHKAASLPPTTLQQYGSSRGFANLPHQRFIPDSENAASQSQSRRLRQSSVYVPDILSEHDLMIDEGTISISSAYSERVLNTLTEALQNTGLDLSQASVSVNINLGKRAFNRSVSNPKDPSFGNETFGHSPQMVSSAIEEPEHANNNKRHKPDTR